MTADELQEENHAIRQRVRELEARVTHLEGENLHACGGSEARVLELEATNATLREHCNERWLAKHTLDDVDPDVADAADLAAGQSRQSQPAPAPSYVGGLEREREDPPSHLAECPAITTFSDGVALTCSKSLGHAGRCDFSQPAASLPARAHVKHLEVELDGSESALDAANARIAELAEARAEALEQRNAFHARIAKAEARLAEATALLVDWATSCRTDAITDCCRRTAAFLAASI